MSFECETCNFKYFRSEIILHINAVHERFRKFDCEICGHKFLRKLHLEKHVSVIH